MTVAAYLEAQQFNLVQLKRLPHYTTLVVPIDGLYRQAPDLLPASSRVIFGRLLLLSHRSFLSAASLALRALPDDAEAITRRALEAARLAIAIKHDPKNLKLWAAYETRLARWRSRQMNERPGDLRLGLNYPKDNPVLEQIGKLIGMLSDTAVHFTPEFLPLEEPPRANARGWAETQSRPRTQGMTERGQ